MKFNRSHHDLQGHPESPDLIDFPVSDVWREHYAQGGYTRPTPRSPAPPGHIARIEKEVLFLQEEIAGLNAEIRQLKEQRHNQGRNPLAQVKKAAPAFAGVPEELLDGQSRN